MEFKRPGQFLNYLKYRAARTSLAAIKESWHGIEVEARAVSNIATGHQRVDLYLDGKRSSRSAVHERLARAA